MIYIRDFEAVQKTHSHVLSGVKTLGFASSFLNLKIHSFSFFKDFDNEPATSRAPSTQYLDQAIKYKKFPERWNKLLKTKILLVGYNAEIKFKILRENDSGPRESGT